MSRAGRYDEMRTTLMLGDLICCLYDEYRLRYDDDGLAALAADVALNDLLMQSEVRDLFLGEAPNRGTRWRGLTNLETLRARARSLRRADSGPDSEGSENGTLG